mmetsp:Transcript_60526/g.161417  ORF Transcript_60526/g.161417 Transcript_60526/m.161417 type:complete len:90 (+) Transcript_60526:232-501(+)
MLGVVALSVGSQAHQRQGDDEAGDPHRKLRAADLEIEAGARELHHGPERYDDDTCQYGVRKGRDRLIEQGGADDDHGGRNEVVDGRPNI